MKWLEILKILCTYLRCAFAEKFNFLYTWLQVLKKKVDLKECIDTRRTILALFKKSNPDRIWYNQIHNWKMFFIDLLFYLKSFNFNKGWKSLPFCSMDNFSLFLMFIFIVFNNSRSVWLFKQNKTLLRKLLRGLTKTSMAVLA